MEEEKNDSISQHKQKGDLDIYGNVIDWDTNGYTYNNIEVDDNTNDSTITKEQEDDNDLKTEDIDNDDHVNLN